MQLFYKEYPGPGPVLIIMHGLFGMLDNWHNLARKFSEKYHVFLLDLRNHGQSEHSDEMDYSLMAEDLREFMLEHFIPSAVILGHSMGGKVAMEFALNYPELTQKLIVADIAPVKYKPGHNEIFDALFNLDIEDGSKTRSDLDQELQVKIPDFGTRQFLMKSLVRKPEGGYEWKFNLQGLYDNYEKILAAPKSDLPYEGPTLFIRGGASPYVREAHFDTIASLFPSYKLVTLEGAGHWVHAEKPAELIAAVEEFIS